MEWQPIETAPKDGSSVLLFDDGVVSVAEFDNFFGWTAFYIGDMNNASHWMPLPPPPEGKE